MNTRHYNFPGRHILHPSFFYRLFLAIIVVSLCSCTASASAGGTTGEIRTIQNKGSDTMVNLALAWAERYQELNPNLLISVTGGGSGTGITALAQKTVDIANASRAIKLEEIEAMRAVGVEPVELTVARDAIAVIVHLDNPVDQLTLEQISAVYSGQINNWQELGGEDRPIVRLSRETNSGTHVYFLEEVLRLGDSENTTFFSADTLLMPSSEGITAEVRDNPNAIGYDGLGYVTEDIKVLAVASKAGAEYVMPSADTVSRGVYPIARDLYIYTAGQPDELEAAYLDWILSDEAQAIVTELGFVPVSKP